MKKIIIILAALLAPAAFALNVSDYSDITPKVDEAPVPLKTPPPEYPASLKDKGITGTVIVTVVIDENGNVLAAEAKKSTDERFNVMAVEGVKKWKFKAAKLAGKPVKVMVNVPIIFSVE